MNNNSNDLFGKNVDNYMHYIMGIVGSIALLYGLIHAWKGKELLGMVDLTVGILLLGLLIFGRRLSQKVKGLFLAIFLLIFLTFLVYDGATGNVGYLWMIVYPSVIFYILGLNQGGRWVGVGALSLVSMSGLHLMNMLELPYENIVIIQFNVVYGVMSLLSYLAEKDRHRRSLVLEKTSQRLTFVIRNSPIIVFILDKKGDFVFSDGAGLSGLGLKPGEVVGKSAIEMYKDFPLIVNGIKKALSGEKASDLVLLREYYFQTQFSPIVDDRNQITGVMGLAIDVTSEQKNKTDVEGKLEEFEKLNKLMIGRELKMAEMKEQMQKNKLENKN